MATRPAKASANKLSRHERQPWLGLVRGGDDLFFHLPHPHVGLRRLVRPVSLLDACFIVPGSSRVARCKRRRVHFTR